VIINLGLIVRVTPLRSQVTNQSSDRPRTRPIYCKITARAILASFFTAVHREEVDWTPRSSLDTTNSNPTGSPLTKFSPCLKKLLAHRVVQLPERDPKEICVSATNSLRNRTLPQRSRRQCRRTQSGKAAWVTFRVRVRVCFSKSRRMTRKCGAYSTVSKMAASKRVTGVVKKYESKEKLRFF
jgi:hypothetical protein